MSKTRTKDIELKKINTAVPLLLKEQQDSDLSPTSPEEKSWSPEQLRERGKQLEVVDKSFRAKCQFFECFGLTPARKHAGFTPTEIAAIEAQKKRDWQDKLNNPSYLRGRARDMRDVDSSWTAYFEGKTAARKKEGFKWDEVKAIEKQQEADKEKIRSESFFNFNSFKKALSTSPINTQLKKQRNAAIRERQEERSISMQPGDK